ncbi:MAG: choline ABC transporter permease, partial [Oscillospiraceae bacterium]
MNFAHFWDTYAVMLLKAIAIHLGYVLVSVSVGFIIALILGVLLTRIPTISKFVLPVLSVFQTIPGIVFIGILFIYIGMVPATVLIALSIYAIFPVLKNTYAGILNVDEKYREAA